MRTIGYAAQDDKGVLSPFTFDRRALRANDVAIEILYCGVCHSDLHFARNDWGMTIYPLVPGHEIVGRVIDVGPDATTHAVGDIVAVGCMTDSCLHCDQCGKGEEQHCREGCTYTYGNTDRVTGEPTRGGYSKHIVVRQEFVLRMPDGLDVAQAAPLLCAGITTWLPLRAAGTGPATRVGVVGMGGLGHMAIKLARALGAHVTAISRTPDKAADARALGADAFLLSGDEDAMARAVSTLDLIIDTVPVKHAVDPYLPLLDVDGTLCIVGQIGPIAEMNSFPLLFGRRRISGSFIGGIAQTQELLDFCAKEGVLPDVEMIRIDQINQAFDRMERADVRYRFVIDMASLDQPPGS